jgi:mRNA-degrading endonuclease toxin of MazEF toxin-antitoxin module
MEIILSHQGAEVKKTRPALILQNDITNRHSPITIVAAITSRFEEPLPVGFAVQGSTRCSKCRRKPSPKSKENS